MNLQIAFTKSKITFDLSHFGIVCETTSDGSKIFLNNEGKGLFDPYRIVCLEDEDGSLDYKFRTLDGLLNKSNQMWVLNTEGILQASQFSFTLSQKGIASKISVEPGKNKEIELPGLSSGLIFVLNLIFNNQSPIEIISLIKGVFSKYEFLKRSINLSPYLEGIKISELGSITPQVIDQGQGYASVGLNFTYLDEQGIEAGSGDLRHATTVDGTNVIKVGQSNFLRLNPEETQIVNHLKRKDFRNVKVTSLPTEAIDLMPVGLSSDRFNLSEYNPRVIGFGASSKPVELSQSSGVEWYQNDNDSSFIVSLVINKNDKIKINYDSLETILKDLKKIEEQLGAKANGSGNKSFTLASGQVVPLNSEILNALKEAFVKLNKEGKPVSEDLSKANKTISAIIQEKHIPTRPSRVVDSSQFWDLVQSSLREEIQLKPHQVSGVNFLLRHFIKNEGGAFIADDMGLGKTLQTLSFLAGVRKFRNRKPILIVAPVILLKNWANEIEKFFKDEVFKVYQLHGDGLSYVKNSQGIDASKLANKDVLLTNYKTLASWQTSLLKLDFSVVIFDESQNIKNPNTSTASSARGVKSDFVICLSGTPVENRLLDVWSQVSALQRNVHPLGQDIKDFHKNFEMCTNGLELIKKAIGYPGSESILIRREKSEVTSLKPLKYKTEYIPMSSEQVEDEANIIKVYSGNPLGVLQNLQKIYQHPALLTNKSYQTINTDELILTSPKLKWLIEKLKFIKAKGEKVIVFTLWRDMQDIILKVVKEELSTCARLINGDTNSKDTEAADRVIKLFTRSDGFDLIVASPIAAGAGLNITAATHVIHYGRWWNPAKEDQATCRAYRIGQDREVTVYYPILHHPERLDLGFDVKLHDLVEHKRKLSTDFLNPAITDFTDDDAKLIFGE
jgi:hypothetical protein